MTDLEKIAEKLGEKKIVEIILEVLSTGLFHYNSRDKTTEDEAKIAAAIIDEMKEEIKEEYAKYNLR